MAVDLNLIVALDALLQERSVTRAAQRLGLSQPSLSASLSRLRRHYDDELLTRVGNTYELTALGERLLEQTGQALASTERVLQTRPKFDPATSDHEFTIVIADCHMPVFGRVFVDLLAKEAPDVRVKFHHSSPHHINAASDQLRTVDAIVLPQGVLANMPTLQLYRDRWVCVVATETAADPLTIDELSHRPWVVAYQQPLSRFSPMPRMLAEGMSIRAAVTTEDFLAVPYLVAGSDRIGLMPERIARLEASKHDIVVTETPFDLGYLVESLWWHPVNERDPAHIWLRQLSARAGQIIDGPSGT
ncbi:LysR family transcriptional regulator [Mycolicibacterium sp. 018/SC-01/001]|uniref:LysR family transcriptional regulator n=1 Tax=Mycolicibacterium sp. 018/SC-01/001 TaxID=2592069 RepID=UPI001C8F6EA2|nr:LysR family transcriptional regulator [Mycolicibacterium sp. 018/SC-01/001]